MSSMRTWEGFMVPILEVLSDGADRTARSLREEVPDHVGLTEAERAEVLKSGQTRADNRINWALSFLTRAGALQRPKRGSYMITDLGHELRRENPGDLTEKHLKTIPAYVDRVPVARGEGAGTVAPDDSAESSLDPIEQIEGGVNRVHADVAAELLRRLRDQQPEFLEQSVLDVLVAMGYGGVEQRAQRIGGSGDGGVDGVIDQDPLGLARIYVQAKRYAADHGIGRPQIQGFVGALHGHQAHQGVFITTSYFSRDATDYAASVNASVVLIDGARLATLMIQYGVGVQTVQTYTVVELDEDYFE